MNEQLDVDYWKDKTMWEEYQIPYLFLGYEPPSSYNSYLDDVITLDEHEEDLYVKYKALISEAITLGKLTPVAINLRSYSSLKASDIKEWRENKHFIEPVEIYVEMEKKIQEPDTALFPSDITWKDITWTFLSNELVRVEAKGVSKKYTCFQLGFIDDRKGDTPDTRWAILSELAKNNGEITWKTNINSKEKNRMTAAVKDIRKRLKAFF